MENEYEKTLQREETRTMWYVIISSCINSKVHRKFKTLFLKNWFRFQML